MGQFRALVVHDDQVCDLGAGDGILRMRIVVGNDLTPGAFMTQRSRFVPSCGVPKHRPCQSNRRCCLRQNLELLLSQGGGGGGEGGTPP